MNTKSGLIIVHLRTIPSTRCLLKYVSLPSSALLSSSASISSSSSASISSSSSASSLSLSSASSLSLSSASSSALSSASSLVSKVALEWECAACTFINKGTLFICELCGGAKCGKATTQVSEVSEVSEVVKIFTFKGLFDKDVIEDNGFNIDGVLFYIGTMGRIQLYRNPHEAGYVVASRSSDGMFGGGDVGALVGRKSEINVTADKVNSWMAVDLGVHRSLVVNHLCLRYGWSCTSAGIHFPQNFELQGSANGANWEMIQRYENDMFNNAPACPSPANFGGNQPWAHWEVSPTNGATGAFRHFRIFQFEPHQGGHNVLALSGIELYGELTERSS